MNSENEDMFSQALNFISLRKQKFDYHLDKNSSLDTMLSQITPVNICQNLIWYVPLCCINILLYK